MGFPFIRIASTCPIKPSLYTQSFFISLYKVPLFILRSSNVAALKACLLFLILQLFFLFKYLTVMIQLIVCFGSFGFQAVANVNTTIAPALIGKVCTTCSCFSFFNWGLAFCPSDCVVECVIQKTHLQMYLPLQDPTQQAEIDNFMVQQLDGTSNEWGWCKQKV